MMVEDVIITEYHCCCECKYQISVPGKVEEWESGCLHRHGKPNASGGLTSCEYWEE